MKKLTKLHVNPEKLMKNEELTRIRGGYGTCYYCENCDHEGLGTIYGTGLTQYEAVAAYQASGYTMTCYAQEGTCN